MGCTSAFLQDLAGRKGADGAKKSLLSRYKRQSRNIKQKLVRSNQKKQ